MIARGHAQFPELDLRVHANLPLPFDPGTFDVCIVFAVLTCIPSDGGHVFRRMRAGYRSVATRVVQLSVLFLPDGLPGVKSLVFSFRMDSPFKVMV